MNAEFFSWDLSEVHVERITEFFKDIINTLQIRLLNGDLSKPSAPAEINNILSVWL